MPKKKLTQLASMEKNFNEASEFFHAAELAEKSTSLLHRMDTLSPLSYLTDSGFQVYTSPENPIFQAALLHWLPPDPVCDVPAPTQLSYFLNQDSMDPCSSAELTQAIIAPMVLSPYAKNQSISKFQTLLSQETKIPFEMSWEFETDSPVPTLTVKAPFRPTLPFREKHYNFPCFTVKEGELLSGPITIVDPFLIQFYKCAMEWLQLLNSCTFRHKLLHEDIINLVIYQLRFDALFFITTIFNFCLFINENVEEQKIYIFIQKISDKFSKFDQPLALFQKDSTTIKNELEALEKVSQDLILQLLIQGLLETADKKIDSFHKVANNLIIFIQNGPFSDKGVCCFTGLLMFIQSITFLPQITALAQYTLETTDKTSRFLNPAYTDKMIQFLQRKKNFLPDCHGLSKDFIDEQLNKYADIETNVCKINFDTKILIRGQQNFYPLVLSTEKDFPEQLFQYCIDYTNFTEPFLYFHERQILPPTLLLTFDQVNTLITCFVKKIVIPFIYAETNGSTEKKSSTETTLHFIEIILAKRRFQVYPNYLLTNNCLLIQEALCANATMDLLDHLREGAIRNNFFPVVAKSFYLLFRVNYANYLQLIQTVDECTKPAQLEFIAQHNAFVEAKAAKAAEKLLAQVEQETKNICKTLKKEKLQTKKLPPQKLTEMCRVSKVSVTETSNTKEINPQDTPMEDTLQKYFDQLQSEMHRITMRNQLHTLPSIQEKIDYLTTCIHLLTELLKKTERRIADKKILYILQAVISVEIFYYLGLLLSYQLTKFFNEKNINNFNYFLSTFKILKEELENINFFYASILTEQYSIPEDDQRMKILNMLLQNIDFTVSHIENITKTMQESLQKASAKKQKRHHTLHSTQKIHMPLYVIASNYKEISVFFNEERGLQDLQECSGKFFACSTSISAQLKQNIGSHKPRCHPQSYLFSPDLERNKTDSASQNSSLDDTQSTFATRCSVSL